ncbi:hypothetical protein D7X33_20790, partial [Butyricicoccus sp. 1XD8-22]
PRACAAGGGALPLHPAPARRAAELCPCTPRLRGERQGSALHPLGLSPQTPEMLAHLFLACGRDGGLGLSPVLHAQSPSPPERRRTGRFSFWVLCPLTALPHEKPLA